MGKVTIAATYGCGGSIIGPSVAKKVALPFVDRAIPPALAARIHEPLVAALADDAEAVKPAIAGPVPNPRTSIQAHSSQSETPAVRCLIKNPPISITQLRPSSATYNGRSG